MEHHLTATLEILCDGSTVLVQANDVTVGRTAACTVRVVHPLVSREHCRLEIRADGLFVVDLGSVNGTWLNGKRVETRMRAVTADKIGLGREGAVLTVKHALLGGVDVASGARQEDMKTMVAGDPRAKGAVARVEVDANAIPSLGEDDEPATRGIGDGDRTVGVPAAGGVPAADGVAALRAAATAPAQKPAREEEVRTEASVIPVVPALETSEVRPPAAAFKPVPAPPPQPAPSQPAPPAAAAAATAPPSRGFWTGFAVGLAIALVAVVATAKFTPALNSLRGRLGQAVSR